MIQSLKYLVFILIIQLTTSESLAQDNFIINKWKSKQKFTDKTIIFQIDTASAQGDMRPYLLAIDRAMTQLDLMGYSCKIIPYSSDTKISEEILILRLEKLPSAYVRFGPFGDPPACYRMKIIQTNSSLKKKIETTVSISIPEFENGINQFGQAFALELDKHFIDKKSK